MGSVSQQVRRAAAIMLAIAAAVAIILLLPGEPCAEFNGWRFVKIWPRPEHC